MNPEKKKLLIIARKNPHSVKHLLRPRKLYPLNEGKMQLVSRGSGAREDQDRLPPETKAGRFDTRVEQMKRNGGGRCYVEEKDHLGLHVRLLPSRGAPVWYVRIGKDKRTRDIYFGRYTTGRSENGAYTYEVCVQRARQFKAYRGVIQSSPNRFFRDFELIRRDKSFRYRLDVLRARAFHQAMKRADCESPALSEDERAELRSLALDVCGATTHPIISAHAKAAIAAVAPRRRATAWGRGTPPIYVPAQQDPQTKSGLLRLHREVQRSTNSYDKLLARSIIDLVAYMEARSRYRRELVEAADVPTSARDDARDVWSDVQDVFAGMILEGKDQNDEDDSEESASKKTPS
jgi:hypothetical protein